MVLEDRIITGVRKLGVVPYRNAKCGMVSEQRRASFAGRVAMLNTTPNRLENDHICVEIGCEHCRACGHHEPWCRAVNKLVGYAFQIVTDPDQVSFGDMLILHSLGVIWDAKCCLEFSKAA